MAKRSSISYFKATIIGLLCSFMSLLSPAHAQEKCNVSQDVVINIYGEQHETPEAIALQSKLFNEAEKGETLFLPEAAPESINYNNEFKELWLTKFANRANQNILNNVRAIDSDLLKFLSFSGYVYIESKQNQFRSMDDYSVAQLVGQLYDLYLHNSPIINQTLNDSGAERIKTEILNLGKRDSRDLEAYKRALFSHNSFDILLREIHARTLNQLKEQDSSFPETPIDSFSGSGEQYFYKMLVYRDEYMAKNIYKSICNTEHKLVSIKVGLLHMKPLHEKLEKIIPNNKINSIVVGSASLSGL